MFLIYFCNDNATVLRYEHVYKYQGRAYSSVFIFGEKDKSGEYWQKEVMKRQNLTQNHEERGIEEGLQGF